MAEGDGSGPRGEGVPADIGLDGIVGKPLRCRARINRLYPDLVRIIGGKKLNRMIRPGRGKRQEGKGEERERREQEPHGSTGLPLNTILPSGRPKGRFSG